MICLTILDESGRTDTELFQFYAPFVRSGAKIHGGGVIKSISEEIVVYISLDVKKSINNRSH